MGTPRVYVRPPECNALRIPGSQEREELLQALSASALRQRQTAEGQQSPSAIRAIADRAYVTEEAIYHQCDGQTIVNWMVAAAEWMDAALAAGKPAEHALAPLHWLARRYQVSDRAGVVDLARTSASTLASASAAVQVALGAIDSASPGGEDLTPDEFAAYRRSRLELSQRLAELDAEMESRAHRGAYE